MMNSRLALLAVLAVTFSSVALGAASGTLTLSGVVTGVSNITVVPNGANNTTLNITGGEASKNVAAVSEQSNNAAGYKITAFSTNSSQLFHSVDNSKRTAYQISYGGGSFVSMPSSASPLQLKNVASLAALTSATSQVLINVTAAPSAIAGTYQDTITFSIVAN